MNTQSTFGTAIIRGLYNAGCSAAASAITCYLALRGVSDVSRSDNLEVSLLTGALSGLAVLGFRGVVEGRHDAGRAASYDVKPSDVGHRPPNPGV